MKDNFDEYEPIGHFMLLVPKLASEVSTGGLFIPEQARKTLTQGTVVKVGSLVQNFKLGDEVIYIQHTEHTITVDGRNYILLEDSNIILAKRVESNPSNPINKLMQMGTWSFDECLDAFRKTGDYDEALSLLNGG